VFASGLKDLKENGGKEIQFIASQTSQDPVSGGKGWQFYATCFAKNNENGCKDKESKEKLHTKTQGTGIVVARLLIRR
jgi:hypothetical protein